MIFKFAILNAREFVFKSKFWTICIVNFYMFRKKQHRTSTSWHSGCFLLWPKLNRGLREYKRKVSSETFSGSLVETFFRSFMNPPDEFGKLNLGCRNFPRLLFCRRVVIYFGSTMQLTSPLSQRIVILKIFSN